MPKLKTTNLSHPSTFGSANKRYNLSFTAASLRPELARIVAEAYLGCNDWVLARQQVLDQNALQSRTPSSGLRMEMEFRQRVQTLTPNQIEILASAPSDSRTAITWLSMLKRSSFVFEFAAEVVRTKLETVDPVLRPSDYETFWAVKSASHPELLTLTSTSQVKIRSMLFAMMREAGLLLSSPQGDMFCRPVIPHDVQVAIIADNRLWLAGFLVPDNEIVSMRG